MSRWWRAYDEAASDPKLGLLSDELHRAWFNLMCIASANDGAFPPLKQMAYTLRVKPERAAAILAELHTHGLLDKTDDGFAPHNWNGRQYKTDSTDPTAAERMQRYRKNKRNDRNATVTPLRPETETETETEADTESEKKETREVALDDGWPENFRILFWGDWPNKVGKPKAMNELERLRKRGVAWPTIFDGMHRYIRTKPPDRPWLNPATFLHQERFNDQPAEVASGKSESLANVARRQADAGISFGPRPTGLRIVESGDDVRLLPEAGRERSGDLRGSGNCDPVGVSGFGD